MTPPPTPSCKKAAFHPLPKTNGHTTTSGTLSFYPTPPPPNDRQQDLPLFFSPPSPPHKITTSGDLPTLLFPPLLYGYLHSGEYTQVSVIF